MTLGDSARGVLLVWSALLVACAYSGDESDWQVSTSAETDGSAGDEGGGGDGPPPEDERDGDFRVPEASGRFVYSASETTDSVAVIDSLSLAIRVAGVGRGPTVVATLGTPATDEGAVAVLDQGSDDVAILRTNAAMVTSVDVFPVTPGANNLAVTADGRHVFVYHDVDGPEALGPGSNQELTVIDTTSGQVHGMTVGAHPRDVRFSSDGARAYVVSADGVNVIELASLSAIGKPPLIPVVGDPGIDPSRVEVQISAAHHLALARIQGVPGLTVTQLDTGAQRHFELPGIPTDLDVSEDGTFAIVTVPAPGGSTIFELTLPTEDDAQLEPTSIAGEYVGLARLSSTGNEMILYTTVDPRQLEGAWPGDSMLGGTPAYATGGETDSGTTGGSESTGSTETGFESTTSTTGEAETEGETTGGDPPLPGDDPRQRITVARRDGGAWGLVTLFVERPVTAVGIAPDGRSAVLLHEHPVSGEGPFGYTLVDLTKSFPVKKLQRVPAVPGPVAFTPTGDRSAVLLRDDTLDVRELDRVDLRSFIVNRLRLGSPPEGVGHVDVTRKLFVSQEHPTGRITFVDPDGQVQTITGFRLNDAVKD